MTRKQFIMQAKLEGRTLREGLNDWRKSQCKGQSVPLASVKEVGVRSCPRPAKLYAVNGEQHIAFQDRWGNWSPGEPLERYNNVVYL